MPNTRELELWKLVNAAFQNSMKKFGDIFAKDVTRDLLANGVTVQECKVGDTIYEVDGEHGVVKHNVYEVCVVYKTTATDDSGMEWDDYWTSDDIDTAYKTRGEAEAELHQPPKGE